MKDFTTFFLAASCRDQCKNSNCGLPEGSLCLKLNIFPGCTLLGITFSMWHNLNQLPLAQSPFSLIPSVRHPIGHTSSHHTCCQLCDFWHRISFLVLDMIRHFSAPRDPEHCPLPEHEFLGPDCCSDQVVWTRSACYALARSLMGTLGTPGTPGCSHATEQTCCG